MFQAIFWLFTSVAMVTGSKGTVYLPTTRRTLEKKMYTIKIGKVA